MRRCAYVSKWATIFLFSPGDVIVGNEKLEIFSFHSMRYLCALGRRPEKSVYGTKMHGLTRSITKEGVIDPKKKKKKVTHRGVFRRPISERTR